MIVAEKDREHDKVKENWFLMIPPQTLILQMIRTDASVLRMVADQY